MKQLNFAYIHVLPTSYRGSENFSPTLAHRAYQVTGPQAYRGSLTSQEEELTSLGKDWEWNQSLQALDLVRTEAGKTFGNLSGMATKKWQEEFTAAVAS